MARLLLLLFFVALMGFTAQALLFGKRFLPDPGQRTDARNAILRKLFGKGEDMNKYAEAFNWEDEYAPDFMPEEVKVPRTRDALQEVKSDRRH